MSACACGSGNDREVCCDQYLFSDTWPPTAEAMIRARYTAHTQGNMAFVLKTHHPATRTEVDEASTARWARESQWMGLEIRSIEGDSDDSDTARIDFMARYRDSSGVRRTHHELGVFQRHNERWYFKDAELPQVGQMRRDQPKQGRNDPCACGSGKKYKKCCGTAA